MTSYSDTHVFWERFIGLLLSLYATQSVQLKVPDRITKSIEPWFAEPIPNMTVAEGRTVSLPCVVEYLGNYQLAWIHTDRPILLTMHEKVITKNPRISVFQNSYRTWWLNINHVELSDRGQYMCQINTAPMKSQVGYLNVVVPPQIDEDYTSSDMSVREGSDVSLRCRAHGSPDPDIKWRREDEKDITIDSKRASTIQGGFLTIRKVSRLHMAAYLCIASNGIQPAVSKRIMLNVNFAPMVLIPNQLIGAAAGTDVTMVCNLESSPRSISYWVITGGIVVVSNDKYDVLAEQISIYKVKLQLRIRKLQSRDFGFYTCVAKNSLGENEGIITLYEKKIHLEQGYGTEHNFTGTKAQKELMDNDIIPFSGKVKQDLVKKNSDGERKTQFMSAEILQSRETKEGSSEGVQSSASSNIRCSSSHITTLMSSVTAVLCVLHFVMSIGKP